MEKAAATQQVGLYESACGYVMLTCFALACVVGLVWFTILFIDWWRAR